MENQYSNEAYQRLAIENQKLIEENLQLRTQLQGSSRKKSGPSILGGISWFSAGIFMGKKLKKSLVKLYTEIPQKEVTRETLADVTAHALWRFTRVSMVGLLIALVPTAMVIIQTYLMQQQTKLITAQSSVMQRQNDLVERQNLLIEQQIDTESSDNKEALYNDKLRGIRQDLRVLENRKIRSPEAMKAQAETIGKDIRTLTPYVMSTTQSGVLLSPERGVALKYLLAEKKTKDNLDLPTIYGEASFSNSDLNKAELFQADLRGIRLNESNLANANLRQADLQGAQLAQAFLDGAFLSNAKLYAADFNSCSAKGTFFNAADLRNSNFSNADLTEADFRGIDNLDNANFTSAILDNVKVSDPDWLRDVDGSITGWGDIRSTYVVNDTPQQDGNGTYFLIIRRD
ncbi:MAG: pentapeptide repeat-containing protein [Bacteroidota bacterium]